MHGHDDVKVICFLAFSPVVKHFRTNHRNMYGQRLFTLPTEGTRLDLLNQVSNLYETLELVEVSSLTAVYSDSGLDCLVRAQNLTLTVVCVHRFWPWLSYPLSAETFEPFARCNEDYYTNV